ncbi:hypothetical protein TREVI0001_0900 [Treponema vincentii ATCC 35580]|uniref:Uncharacterized protein n=1 Tax=Treponema vincentii ATCC 35580 TaxID=596324 RepID=C8PR30_9SPIR|nr:hypothetical protein TREVI0001_0900 [Treponema vincentii ATCC 35580]
MYIPHTPSLLAGVINTTQIYYFFVLAFIFIFLLILKSEQQSDP